MSSISKFVDIEAEHSSNDDEDDVMDDLKNKYDTDHSAEADIDENPTEHLASIRQLRNQEEEQAEDELQIIKEYQRHLQPGFNPEYDEELNDLNDRQLNKVRIASEHKKQQWKDAAKKRFAQQKQQQNTNFETPSTEEDDTADIASSSQAMTIHHPMRRTDTSERNFLLTAHDDLLEDSPPDPKAPIHCIEGHIGEGQTHNTTTATSSTSSQPVGSPASPNYNPTTSPTIDLTTMYDDDDVVMVQQQNNCFRSVVEPDSTEPQHQGKFRIRSKCVGLTYPQCNIDLADAVTKLQLLLQPLSPTIVVAREDHHLTDGLHLHAYIALETALSTRNERYFDLATTDKVFHPNILIPKNRNNWLKYVIKDNNYSCYPQTFKPAPAQKQTPVSESIAKKIINGATTTQITNEHPGYALLHLKQLRDFITTIKEQQRVEKAKESWSKLDHFVSEPSPNFQNSRIAGWLNDNLLQPRKFRQQMLWIQGPTGCGKTSIITNLIKLGCILHNVDLATHFYDGITEETQLIVFDEFKAQRTITEMNKICDGGPCNLDIKGSHFYKEKPVAVLVLSNFTIKGAYHNSDQQHLTTLESRFIMIECTEPIKLNFVLK